MEKTKLKNFAKVLVFNVAEAIIIFLLGKIFSVDISIRIMFMVTFFLTRMLIGSPKHYNKAYRCAIWSCLVFVSLYSLSNLDLIAIILLTIFTGFISTGKADINDSFMWKGNDSKYEALRNFIALSPNNPILLEHEEYWRKNYLMRYKILQSFYREGKSYSKIVEEENFRDDTIIKSECKTIYAILEKPLNLPPIK